MITNILKFIFTSSFLFIIYHLFLEKEKIYKFNRFYLLFSIFFSLVIPFITFHIKSTSIPFNEPVILNDYSIQDTGIQFSNQSTTDMNILRNILLGIYLLTSIFLFCRFLKNIFSVFFKIRNNKSLSYLNAKLILLDERQTPYSFLKYIFINNDEFQKGKIEDEILSHELTHVKQKHSFDILFIELLIIFAWINPILFLYRRAIQLNHEFLADESVIRFSDKIKEYQYLLIIKSDNVCNPVLLSTFNFSTIKKRIIMMNKDVSPGIAMIKKFAVISVIVIIGFFLTFKIVAKNSETKVELQQTNFQNEGVSQKLLDEYNDIINRHRKLINGNYSVHLNGFTKSEQDRLENIFQQMTQEQKLSQKYGFIPLNTMYLKRVVPSEEQFESFKDPKMYGVWINEKRVDNKILNNYKNTGFAQVSVSRLAKNAKNYGKHVYQVDLMTTDYYESYVNEVKAREGNMLVQISMYKRMVA